MAGAQDNTVKQDAPTVRKAHARELNGLIGDLQQAASALTQPSAFSTRRTIVSSPQAAAIIAWPGAPLGSHTLTITHLAQSHKIVTCQVADSSAALGLHGSFTLNGRTITARQSDSLADLSVKINAVRAGVTATVIHLGPQKFRMTLTGNLTGATNTLSAADNGQGTILEDLGLLTDSLAIRQSVTTPEGQSIAASIALDSATQTVAYTLGAPEGSLAAGDIVVKFSGLRAAIPIDLNRDSLNSIAGKINGAALSGLSAQVIALSDPDGKISIRSRRQLQIMGLETAQEIRDDEGILNTLGIVQKSFLSPLVVAQDAKFILDDVPQTRSTNVVADIIPGAVVKLLAGKPTAPLTAELRITQDIERMLTLVQRCLQAYNTLHNARNSPQLQVPAEVADNKLSAENDLPKLMECVAGDLALEEIGIHPGASGCLVCDEAKITVSLQDDPARVMRAFGLVGLTTNPNIQFITAGAQMVSSPSQGFPIWLDTVPSRSVAIAAAVQTKPSIAVEVLTFEGELLPGPVQITLPVGNTVSDTVNQINRYASLVGKLSASVDDISGALCFSSLAFGTKTAFTVVSDRHSGDGTESGVGSALAAIPGRNADGTVNGEPMQGSGRTLIGCPGNNTTEGLQLLVNTNQHGDVGRVIITRGFADRLSTALALLLEPAEGNAIGADSSLGTQISDSQQQMQKLRHQADAYADYLRQTYFAMEARLVEMGTQRTIFASRHRRLKRQSS